MLRWKPKEYTWVCWWRNTSAVPSICRNLVFLRQKCKVENADGPVTFNKALSINQPGKKAKSQKTSILTSTCRPKSSLTWSSRNSNCVHGWLVYIEYNNWRLKEAGRPVTLSLPDYFQAIDCLKMAVECASITLKYFMPKLFVALSLQVGLHWIELGQVP